MSIVETVKIDMIGVPESDSNSVVLGIADHLSWEEDQAGEHLLLLQEKLNSYIRFIESGEMLESFPAARGKSPTIRVMGRVPLGTEARKFFAGAQEQLRRSGIELEFEHSP